MQNQGNIDNKFWQDYYQKWDNFVKDWYDQIAAGQAEPQDEVSQAYKQAVEALVFDELPTPYLGSPHKGVDAVIINLNPGLSELIRFGDFVGCNGDEAQYFSNIGQPIGYLIRDFIDKAEKEYSKFIGIDSSINMSCLNPKLLEAPEWVCGVDWWQGYPDDRIELSSPKRKKNQRLPWLSRIYGKTILPERVFALELCPYHSKNFSLDDKNPEYKKVLTEFISQYVIQPAVKAVIENNLPFAVAVGADSYHILKKIENNEVEGVNARLIDRWCCEGDKDKQRVFSNDRLSSIWPMYGDGRGFKVRSYYLYDISINDLGACLLVTYAPGGNNAPSEEFNKDIEREIRECATAVR